MTSQHLFRFVSTFPHGLAWKMAQLDFFCPRKSVLYSEKNAELGIQGPEYTSRHCHLVSVLFLASYFTLVDLNFLNCKIRGLN